MTENLPNKGYIFEVDNIKSRFGNILICLENMLLLAKNTQSVAIIKIIKNSYESLDLPDPLMFDFRSSSNINCGKVINHKQTFLTKYPYNKKLFVDKNNWCINYIHGLIKKTEPPAEINNDTLILNIRGGGDIFNRKKIHGEYFQPPLSYYKSIIKNGNYSDILIVTDYSKHNPVINALLLWNKNIRISDMNMLSQINLILNTKHLVLARSTFSFILSRLSKNLKSIYTWWDNNWKWDEWQPTKDNCLSKDVKITRYHSDDYINFGEWSASKVQLKLMIKHQTKKLKFEVL